MTQKALRFALEALDNLMYWDNGKPEYDEARDAITAIKEALAQPGRTWVGLTDEERKNIMIECESTGDWAWELKAAQAIEAKLKERNT